MLTERQLLVTQVVLVLALAVVVVSVATQSFGFVLGPAAVALGAITMLVLNAVDRRRRL